MEAAGKLDLRERVAPWPDLNQIPYHSTRIVLTVDRVPTLGVLLPS